MDPNNIILATDSYKLTHWKQYPEGTERVYSYFESRQGAEHVYTVFFGLQYILRHYLAGQVVTRERIEEADGLARAHFGTDLFNYEGWKHILDDHNGYLPLRIRAVPEGTRIPVSNVLMTVENTCPHCFWLTNAVESLLTHVWYPSTVATRSHAALKMIGSYVEKTGGDPAGIPFMLHDFGYRGASSHESAAIGGAAHLLASRGTDTLPAMLLAINDYGATLDSLAFSVPATEHSVMTSLGREGEAELVANLLDKYPKGILSVVGDSYDIYNFTTTVGTRFHDEVVSRDGKFVVRPDSGDNPAAQMVDLSHNLWAHFHGTTNEAGYKVFDPHVGLLWGDGLESPAIEEILEATGDAGYAAENYVFGQGGGTLQKVNRDMQRFAFKCSAQMRDGEWVDIFKDPLDSSKVSKRGRMALERNHSTGLFSTTPLYGEGTGDSPANLLKTVFEDGHCLGYIDFEEARENMAAW